MSSCAAEFFYSAAPADSLNPPSKSIIEVQMAIPDLKMKCQWTVIVEWKENRDRVTEKNLPEKKYHFRIRIFCNNTNSNNSNNNNNNNHINHPAQQTLHCPSYNEAGDFVYLLKSVISKSSIAVEVRGGTQ